MPGGFFQPVPTDETVNAPQMSGTDSNTLMGPSGGLDPEQRRKLLMASGGMPRPNTSLPGMGSVYGPPQTSSGPTSPTDIVPQSPTPPGVPTQTPQGGQGSVFQPPTPPQRPLSPVELAQQAESKAQEHVAEIQRQIGSAPLEYQPKLWRRILGGAIAGLGAATATDPYGRDDPEQFKSAVNAGKGIIYGPLMKQEAGLKGSLSSAETEAKSATERYKEATEQQKYGEVELPEAQARSTYYTGMGEFGRGSPLERELAESAVGLSKAQLSNDPNAVKDAQSKYDAAVKSVQAFESAKSLAKTKGYSLKTGAEGLPVGVIGPDGNEMSAYGANLPPEAKALVDSAWNTHYKIMKDQEDRQARQFQQQNSIQADRDEQKYREDAQKAYGPVMDSRERYRVMIDAKGKGDKGDQQADVNLVANHLGMTLGLQKGTRITRAMWGEATASSPLYARMKARFSDDGFLTGVVLTPQQRVQMVGLAKERYQEDIGKVRGMAASGNFLRYEPKEIDSDFETLRSGKDIDSSQNAAVKPTSSAASTTPSAPAAKNGAASAGKIPARPKGVPAGATWNPQVRRWQMAQPQPSQ